jgi:hypothetical protein
MTYTKERLQFKYPEGKGPKNGSTVDMGKIINRCTAETKNLNIKKNKDLITGMNNKSNKETDRH